MGFYSILLDNILIVVGIAVLVVVIAAYILIRTKFIHRLLDWWKPYSEKSLLSKMFCEDGQIRDRNLRIGRYVVSDSVKKVSFYLVHKLLYSKPGSNSKFLVVTERAARPVDFHNKISDDEWLQCPSAQQVFIHTAAAIRNDSAREGARDFLMTALSIMFICVAIIVSIVGILVLWGK